MNDLLKTGARGVDVSHYNPVDDFGLLASAVAFVGIKATEGETFIDSKFAYHQAGVRAQKLDLVIYYHFLRSGSPEDQATRFAKVVGKLLSNERIALDFEVLPQTPGITALEWISRFYQQARIILRTQERRTNFIYTSRCIWDQIGNPDWPMAQNLALWAPRYNSELQPVLPRPWNKFQIWQWSDGETPLVTPVSGMTSPVDMDVWNGTRDDLKQWMLDDEKQGGDDFAFLESWSDGDLRVLRERIISIEASRANSNSSST